MELARPIFDLHPAGVTNAHAISSPHALKEAEWKDRQNRKERGIRAPRTPSGTLSTELVGKV